MQPLSERVLRILDGIASQLADGGIVSLTLLSELEEAWRADCPDQIVRFEALKRDLLTVPEHVDASVDLDERYASIASPAGYDNEQPDEPTNLEIIGYVVRVFFGTNRRRVSRPQVGNYFSSARSDVTFLGNCDVLIPRSHRFGQLGTSYLTRLRRMQLEDDHVTLLSVNQLESTDFWESVRREGGGDEERHGLIYLHGYNVSFKDAAIRAGQLAFDLAIPGPTAFFSWPSRASLLGYLADAATIEASEKAICDFLADFAQQSGLSRIHLVAHSMGNRGLIRALQRLEASSGVKFGQIFLAAPDVDRDTFISLAHLYKSFCQRTTLYASRADRAVGLSAYIHSSPRIGYVPPTTVIDPVHCIDTICVPGFNVDLLGHSYFGQADALLSDMHVLMTHNTPPQLRQRLVSRGDHWEFML